MSIYRRWEFHGKNNDGSFLSSKQIEALIALDEFDLEVLEWEYGEELIGWGDTESSGAYDRIEEALTAYAEIYPDVTLTVYVQCDVDLCPDGFLMKDGKVRAFSGKVTYFFDDDGTEVNV